MPKYNMFSPDSCIHVVKNELWVMILVLQFEAGACTRLLTGNIT